MHVGVRGCDRAVAVCDALRTYLPHLLALSANSPFIEDVWTQLHSVRTQTFVRMFPRCGIPDVFGTWAEHRGFYEELVDTNCIQEFTQVWWSVRPHHRFGTVEVRICDAQTEAWQSLAISSLTVGLIAHLARIYDEGMPLPILETRYVEENLWRAIRYGLDGKLVDWVMGEELTAADAVRHLVELAAPYADAIGLSPHLADVERMLREGNGAQQQARAHVEGESLREVFAGTVAAAHRSSIGETADMQGGSGMSDATVHGRVVSDRGARPSRSRAAEERARLRSRLRDGHRPGEFRLPEDGSYRRDEAGARPLRRAAGD